MLWDGRKVGAARGTNGTGSIVLGWNFKGWMWYVGMGSDASLDEGFISGL
jgi:hypothetical protein